MNKQPPTTSFTLLEGRYKSKTKAIQQLQMMAEINIKALLATKYEDSCFEESNIQKFQTFICLIEQQRIPSSTCEYLKLRASRNDLKHQRDRRTPLEYAIDLILGWISEDVQYEILNMNGFSVSMAGKDSDREIRPGKFVSATADFRISFNSNEKINVEFMVDWLNHWGINNECDVRDHKVNRLAYQGGVFLGINPANATCLLHNFRESGLEGWRHKTNHPKWGKPTWTMTNVNQRMYPLNKAIEVLKSLFG